MVASYIAHLRNGVSPERLEKYRPTGGSDLEMAVNYFWNVSLSEALYPGLAALEVTLRSSIHSAVSAREGTDRWFRGLLEPRQLNDYANACQALYRRRQHQPSSGQIVAELSFGFWTTVLSQPYNRSLWTPNRAALLRSVFPHLPPTPNARHYVHQRYNDLRLLRNRVMHHEPIWHRVGLAREHQKIVEAIGWTNPTVQASISLIDHFEETYQHGRTRIEGDIRRHFNIP